MTEDDRKDCPNGCGSMGLTRETTTEGRTVQMPGRTFNERKIKFFDHCEECGLKLPRGTGWKGPY